MILPLLILSLWSIIGIVSAIVFSKYNQVFTLSELVFVGVCLGPLFTIMEYPRYRDNKKEARRINFVIHYLASQELVNLDIIKYRYFYTGNIGKHPVRLHYTYEQINHFQP